MCHYFQQFVNLCIKSATAASLDWIQMFLKRESMVGLFLELKVKSWRHDTRYDDI
jgi:hypothetical protein